MYLHVLGTGVFIQPFEYALGLDMVHMVIALEFCQEQGLGDHVES